MGKVLLINDSKFECIIIKDILSTLGHDVKVSDEYNALAHVKSYCPDFLIANYIMKEIRGDHLIALVKLQDSNIKCILSSSNEISERDFPNKHIDAVIHTPIDREGMELVLSKVYNKEASQNKGHTLILEEKSHDISTDELKENEKEKEIEITTTEPEAYLEDEIEIIRFCTNCGHRLSHNNNETIKFCPFCGHKL